MTLPLMAALFLPLVLGLSDLYEWARPDAVAASHILQYKAPYLNVPFFLARSAFYFAVWMGLAHFLARGSTEHDRTGDPRIATRLRAVSAPGLVVYGLTVTFASVDWVMSRDPEWFSTMFGILFFGGQALSALTFAIVVLVLLATREPLASVVKPGHLHDLGKLLFAFVMLFVQDRTEAGETNMRALTRDLIDAAIEHDGSYYLPYRLHATQEQFDSAYPQAAEFFRRKREFDPGELFQNRFYVTYGNPGGDTSNK